MSKDLLQIVTPEEARNWLNAGSIAGRFAHTVATEPDRVRAAVVKALLDVAPEMVTSTDARTLVQFARAIEKGADL